MSILFQLICCAASHITGLYVHYNKKRCETAQKKGRLPVPFFLACYRLSISVSEIKHNSDNQQQQNCCFVIGNGLITKRSPTPNHKRSIINLIIFISCPVIFPYYRSRPRRVLFLQGFQQFQVLALKLA